jgi:hypothetical protein
VEPLEEEFSAAERADLLSRWSASISTTVADEMRELEAAEWSIDEYFQTPRRLIDAAMDFDHRHAELRLRARKLNWATADVNPYGEESASQLRFAAEALLQGVAERLADTSPNCAREAQERLAKAVSNFSRMIRKRYRELEIRFAMDAAEVAQNAAPVPGTVSARRTAKKTSTRKIDVDTALGRLERDTRRECEQEGLMRTALDEAMIERVYGLSAANLRPVIAERGCDTSAKTIERSKKYKAWKRYRTRVMPASPEVDCGPARSGIGIGSNLSGSDIADQAIQTGSLSLRKGTVGRTRPGKTRSKSAEDVQADRWAESMGESLPSVD